MEAERRGSSTARSSGGTAMAGRLWARACRVRARPQIGARGRGGGAGEAGQLGQAGSGPGLAGGMGVAGSVPWLVVAAVSPSVACAVEREVSEGSMRARVGVMAWRSEAAARWQQ